MSASTVVLYSASVRADITLFNIYFYLQQNIFNSAFVSARRIPNSPPAQIPGTLAAIRGYSVQFKSNDKSMTEFFICNQDDINSKLQSLTKTRTSVEEWTEYFVDETTNENWLLTRYNSEYHGGGFPVLKRLPEPTIDELINIAMTSSDTNNIIGASLELSEREKYRKEDFRSKLLNRLLQIETSNLSDFEKERIKIIIYESDLYDATNRRNIVGKHFTEVQNDADYYRTIADKAKTVLTKI